MLTEDELAFSNFSGIARLFPLPNLVLLPHVEQGLHIFETRYLDMTVDTLRDDHLIALVLLLADPVEAERPIIAPVACLSRILAHEELPDGRFNLRVRGIARMRILDELPMGEKLYRQAHGQLVGDVIPADIATMIYLRKELRDAVLGRFDPSGSAYRQIDDLFDSDTTLPEICDLLGYALPLPTELKQHLLAEPLVTKRAEMLTHAMLHNPRKDRPFPPKFSDN